MGNIVVFQRRSGVVSLDTARDRRLTPCESKDLRTGSEAGLARSAHTGGSTSRSPPTVLKHLGLTRFAWGTVETGRSDHDAYLLVLLADQELTAGRDAEARCLLDAAYAAFDRRTGDQTGCVARG
jgi:hypothetical protein